MHVKVVRVGLLAAALLVGVVSSAQASWSVALTPAKSVVLGGVSCPTSNDCLVVGGRRTNSADAPAFHVVAPNVRTWNGHRWTQRQLPKPRGAKYVTIGPLTCLPKHRTHPFCMAVGTYWTDSSNKRMTEHVMAERLSGGHWSAQRLPPRKLSFYKQPLFNAISCASTRFCVAVGEENFPATPFTPLMERYNGHRWTATSPSGTSDITGVSCPTTKFCLAVGNVITKVGELATSFDTAPVAMIWNGQRWTPASPPQDHLNAIDCLTASRCLGVGADVTYVPQGTYDSENDVAATQTWKSRIWGVSSPLGPSGSRLTALSCPSAWSCTALGQTDASSATPLPMGVHWNGTEWSKQSLPAKASFPQTVSCASSRSCMAVGLTTKNRSLVLRYRR